MELDHRKRAGEQPEKEEYLDRFAEMPDAVAAAFQETIPPDAQAAAAVRMIDHYSVLASLDAGGQAEVFRVMDQHLQQEAVLKLSRKESPLHSNDAVRHEGQVLARLDHPHLGRVFGAGVYENRTYIVMQMVRGKTLDKWLAEKRDTVKAAGFVATVARALDAAHKQGVTHCDIKPRNIMVDGSDKPTLIDFGVAIERTAFGAEHTHEKRHGVRHARLHAA